MVLMVNGAASPWDVQCVRGLGILGAGWPRATAARVPGVGQALPAITVHELRIGMVDVEADGQAQAVLQGA
jgi:hypothetical protein